MNKEIHLQRIYHFWLYNGCSSVTEINWYIVDVELLDTFQSAIWHGHGGQHGYGGQHEHGPGEHVREFCGGHCGQHGPDWP